MFRRLFTASSLLALAALPAHAASITVFWDDPNFGGFGVSQATALAAQAAGIPLLPAPTAEFNFPNGTPPPAKIAVTHPAFLSNVAVGVPVGIADASGSAAWTGTNTSGLNAPGTPPQDLLNLYLIFARPMKNEDFTVGGVPTPIEYKPSDVGLQLSSNEAGLADWVILQVPSDPLVPASVPVYYPAVSLGALANGATVPFDLFYTFHNPKVFGEPVNFILGVPEWNLYFTTLPVPEPSTSLLLLLGLGALAAARRARP